MHAQKTARQDVERRLILNAERVCVTAEEAMRGGWSLEANGAVDSITVNGVTAQALYKERTDDYDTDTIYCCAAFVKRFDSQVYGRHVYKI